MKQKTIGENLEYIKKNKVHIVIESRHMPGGSEHNLICWMCNKRPAIYYMNPNWIFMPCRECQKIYVGFWSKKKPWWQFWK